MIILKILLAVIGLLLLLLLIALIRTLMSPAKKSEWKPKIDKEREQAYGEKLAEMVRFETVSVPGKDQRDKFLEFHKILERKKQRTAGRPDGSSGCGAG